MLVIMMEWLKSLLWLEHSGEPQYRMKEIGKLFLNFILKIMIHNSSKIKEEKH
jgi:hypothetical protein